MNKRSDQDRFNVANSSTAAQSSPWGSPVVVTKKWLFQYIVDEAFIASPHRPLVMYKYCYLDHFNHCLNIYVWEYQNYYQILPTFRGWSYNIILLWHTIKYALPCKVNHYVTSKNYSIIPNQRIFEKRTIQTQPTFTCLISLIETPEKCVKSVQSYR